MKKKIYLILALVYILSFILQSAVLASDVMPLNNNTHLTSTAFHISSSGRATVDVKYNGYPNITTGATITITIEKRNLLVFWKDVINDSITVTGETYNNSIYYYLQSFGTGTYRCTVVYTVSGSGGADDVIPYEGTAVYQN